jgi:hypothetical protein
VKATLSNGQSPVQKILRVEKFYISVANGVLIWTLAIGGSCLHEILAFSLDPFLNGRLENATI